MSFTANVQMEKEPVVEVGDKRKASKKVARKKPTRFVFQLRFRFLETLFVENTMKQPTKSMCLHGNDHLEKRLEMHRSPTICWPILLSSERLK